MQGMNRIRHAYVELEPELEPYFVTSRYDDQAGLLQSLLGETSTSPLTQPFLAIPGVIAVVDSVVAGATVGIAGLGFGLGTAGCLVLGGVGLAASVVVFAAWARKQIVRWGELIRPLFPTPRAKARPSIGALTRGLDVR